MNESLVNSETVSVLVPDSRSNIKPRAVSVLS
jgi:hypothetical protein